MSRSLSTRAYKVDRWCTTPIMVALAAPNADLESDRDPWNHSSSSAAFHRSTCKLRTWPCMQWRLGLCKGPDCYGISSDSISRVLKGLTERGLLEVEEQFTVAPLLSLSSNTPGLRRRVYLHYAGLFQGRPRER